MEIEVEAERREERNGDSERQGGDLGWRPREMKVLERELGELGKSARKVGEEEEESSKRLLDGWVEDVKRVSSPRCLSLLYSWRRNRANGL